jgi:hypothetical protein
MQQTYIHSYWVIVIGAVRVSDTWVEVYAQDIDDTGNIEKILYDGYCADIHERGLVLGVLVALQTLVVQEEPRRRAAQPARAPGPA